MAFLAAIFHVCPRACLTLENEMAAREKPRDQWQCFTVAGKMTDSAESVGKIVCDAIR